MGILKIGNIFQANVVLKDNRTPLLIDFGVAHEINRGSYTQEFTTKGEKAVVSAAWMPPELAWRFLSDDMSLYTEARNFYLKGEDEHRVYYKKEGDVWMFGMTIIVGNLSKSCLSKFNTGTSGINYGGDAMEKCFHLKTW